MLPGPSTHLLTLPDAYGAPLTEYSYHPNDELLHVCWHGPLTMAEVIRGVQEGGRWRNQLFYSRILNDISDAGGDWSDALPWLQYEWLPQALSVGVEAFAYVFSPNTANDFVSHAMIEALRPSMAVERFIDPHEAYRWLLTQGPPPGTPRPQALATKTLVR